MSHTQHQWVKQGGSTWRVGLRRFFGTSNWVQNRGTSVCLTWPFFSNMEMASKPFQDVKFRRFLGKRGIMTKRGFKTKLFCTKSRRFRFYVWWWWWASCWSSWSWWSSSWICKDVPAKTTFTPLTKGFKVFNIREAAQPLGDKYVAYQATYLSILLTPQGLPGASAEQLFEWQAPSNSEKCLYFVRAMFKWWLSGNRQRSSTRSDLRLVTSNDRNMWGLCY